MENNKNKKSEKFQGDMLNFYDFIQVFVFTTNHHLKIRLHICIIDPGEGHASTGTCQSHKNLTQNTKCRTPMLTLTISSNENGRFFWV